MGKKKIKKKNKFIYYLCEKSNPDIDLDWMEEESTMDDIISQGLWFLEESSTIDITDGLLSDKITENTLLYHKLIDLVDDIVFCFDPEENENEDMVDNRFDQLCKEYVVLRKNIHTNKFSYVKEHEISNCFERILDNIFPRIDVPIEDFIENQTGEPIKNINREQIKQFTQRVESLFEHEYNHLTLSVDEGRYYNICIMKSNTKSHQEFLDLGELKGEKPTPGGYIYENTYENLINFIWFQLSFNRNLGVSIITTVTKGDIMEKVKNGEMVIQKVFGGLLYLEDDEVKFEQFSAQDILQSYTINSKTGEKISPNKDIIYCGKEKEDVICGFDLV